MLRTLGISVVAVYLVRLERRVGGKLSGFKGTAAELVGQLQIGSDSNFSSVSKAFNSRGHLVEADLSVSVCKRLDLQLESNRARTNRGHGQL